MNSPTPSIELREAKSPEELLAIYRFRYEIYVEEMQRKQHYADHDARLIKDPLDALGWNMAAWEGDTVVGVVRTNPFSDAATDEYRELYELDGEVEFDLAKTVLVTRLMTSKTHRATNLSATLATKTYQQILADGFSSVYIDCNAHLVSWFERLGFRTKRTVEHEEYGTVYVQHLDMYDASHLQMLRSPFLRPLKRHLTVSKQHVS